MKAIYRQFGWTDSLNMGGRITHNLLWISIIANSSGFGSDGLLNVVFVTYTLCALIDLPAGYVADKFGGLKALNICFALRFLGLISFGFAIHASYFYPRLIWYFMTLCAVFDASSIAFLSGSYESAYKMWFAQKLQTVNQRVENSPPLFMEAFKYGKILRFGLPLFAGFVVTVVNLNNDPRILEVAFSKMMFVLSLIFLIHITLMYRINKDLRELENGDSAKRKLISPFDIFKIIQKQTKLNLTLAFSYFSYRICTVYLITQTYLFLRASGIAELYVWLGGIGAAIFIHMIMLSCSSVILPWLGSWIDLKKIQIYLPAIISGLSFCLIAELNYFESPFAHGAAMIFYVVTVGILSQSISTFIQSTLDDKIPQNLQASWFSCANLINMGLMGFVAGLALLCRQNNMGYLGPTFMTSAIAIFGLVIFLWSIGSNKNESSLIPLKKLISFSIILTILVISLIGAFCDFKQFAAINAKYYSVVNGLSSELLVSKIQDEPLLKRKNLSKDEIAAISVRLSDKSLQCFDMKNSQIFLSTCNSLNKLDYFKIEKTLNNAEWTFIFYFNNDDAKSELIKRFCIIILFLFTLGLSVWLGVAIVTRRIYREASLLLDVGDKPLSWSEAKNNFLIEEFFEIGDRLAFNKIENEHRARENEIIALSAKMMGHDIRRPIQYIQMMLRLLSSNKIDQRTEDYVKRLKPEIDSAIKNINSMINDMLAFGKVDLSTESVETKLVNIVKKSFKYTLSSVNKTATIKLDGLNSIAVIGNPDKLSRVFVNLFTNAFESIPEKGNIWILAKMNKDKDGEIEICIGNEGIIIESWAREKIFDSYFTTKTTGNGLGLCICKNIIISLGGSISCRPALNQSGMEFLIKISGKETLEFSESTTEIFSIETLTDFINESKTPSIYE